MRIALFLPSLRGGGAERVMVTLAEGFAERGYRVDMVLVRAEGPFLSEVPDQVRVIDLDAHRTLVSLPALVQYLRRERPNTLLSALDHANVVALWARMLAGVPERLVVSVRNSPIGVRSAGASLKDRLVPFFMRAFYPWADGLVAVSHGVADDLAEMFGVLRERIHVIYNPMVSAELLHQASESLDHPWFALGQPPVLMGAGRLTVQKDFATLIRAFALVRKRRRVRLVILGEGEERSKLESLIHELGLTDDVQLLGFVANPLQYIARAAVFILSSRWEGLPNVLIQALACGVPVVSTDCPSGPSEILEQGRCGSLVPVADFEEMANEILRRLEQPVSRDSSGSTLERFERGRVLAQYEEVLGVSAFSSVAPTFEF